MTRSMPFCSGGVKPRFVTPCRRRCNYLILHRVSEAVLTPVMTTCGAPLELGSSWGPVGDARHQGKTVTRTRMFEVRCRSLLHETFQNVFRRPFTLRRRGQMSNRRFGSTDAGFRGSLLAETSRKRGGFSDTSTSSCRRKTGPGVPGARMLPGLQGRSSRSVGPEPRGEPRDPGARSDPAPYGRPYRADRNTRTRSRASPTFQRAAARGAARPSSPKGPSSQPL